MLVRGILKKDDQGNQIAYTNAAVIQSALSNRWGEVYLRQAHDTDKAAKFLGLYVRQQSHLFDFEDMMLPDEDDVFDTIMGVKDSAAGRDGVSCSAYRACPVLFRMVFVNCGLI